MRALLLLLALSLGPAALRAQPAPFVTGLRFPIGVTTDAAGRVWVAEQGSGPAANDGRISVVLPNGQTFPFLTGLATGGTAAEQRGVAHLAFVGSDLWFTHTTSPSSGGVYRVPTAGFTPGDPPRTFAAVVDSANVARFVFAQGATDSQAYGLAAGPDGTLYVTDAGANRVVRRDPATGALAVVAAFPDLPNPTPVGPPVVQVVPTGIVFADGRLYVSALTGFPFAEGLARVYAVELGGVFAVYWGGLTSLTDVARDPRDGSLAVLRHAVFAFGPPPPGFRPATGEARRLRDGAALATGLSFASGMAYDAAGTLYVATLGGDLYRIASPAACLDPLTEPAFDGRVIADGARRLVAFAVPTGAQAVTFYNTANLVVGAPETSAGAAIPHTRAGDTFIFEAPPPALVRFPVAAANPANTRVSFFARVTDTCGRTVDVDPTLTVTGAEAAGALAFGLAAPAPNPARGPVTLGFTLAAPADVRLALHDGLGREVAVLAAGPHAAGRHTATLDEAALAAGLYVLRLRAGGEERVRPLALVR